MELSPATKIAQELRNFKRQMYRREFFRLMNPEEFEKIWLRAIRLHLEELYVSRSD